MGYAFNESDTKLWVYSSKAIATYFLMFNGFIPLALVIVLEVAKLATTFFVEFDI